MCRMLNRAVCLAAPSLATASLGRTRVTLTESTGVVNAWERWRVGLDALVAMKHSASEMVHHRARCLRRVSTFAKVNRIDLSHLRWI